MKAIDLRSDTVTLPTPAMRDAMYRAELGDDVFGEDPTVNRLEQMAAEHMGKEAAILVTSGTQGNLCGVLSHTHRGDEVILGDQAHIFLNEAGGCAAFGGVQLRIVPNGQGLPDPADVEGGIRTQNIHYPPTGLICLENTHNRCGGSVLTAQETGQIAGIAHSHGVPVHLDGARIFNAAVALGVPASDLARDVDSVTFCLSKGLSCPVGALLCGSARYIQRARKVRKMVGGGMRQAGIIAAAGIVALETMVDRLAEDHENARVLAEGLAEIRGLAIDPRTVRTNILYFDVEPSAGTAAQLADRLAGEGVRCIATGALRIRMVTHYGISPTDIGVTLAAARRVLAG